jgi:hypothetical protein
MPPLVRLEPFLLHRSSLVRDTVGFHYFESWSEEEQLVPLVLEACRRYGEEATLNLLSFGCRFRLAASSLLESLRLLTESRPPFVEQWVSIAPLSLVESRVELLRSVLSPRAVSRILRRTHFHRETRIELWRRLDALCRKLASAGAAPGERDEIDDLLEALAAVDRPESVAAMLLDVEGAPEPARWAIVELAGVMKLKELSESLLDLLGRGEEAISRASVESLARIGSASVVSSIRSRYPDSPREFRRFALSVLKASRHDAAGELLGELAETESHPALLGRIFDALRFHFTGRSESLLRGELERPSSWMLPAEIEKALYVFAELRGAKAAPPADGDVYFHIPFEWEEE